MSKILSYRGLLQDQEQERILLSTRKGETGYRVIKFELMPVNPGVDSGESVVKIYKDSQSAVDAVVNFSNNRLLAAGYYAAESSSYSDTLNIIFDQEIINQDIFITNSDARANDTAINYYLELEVIKLSEHDAMVTTIQSIRNG